MDVLISDYLKAIKNANTLRSIARGIEDEAEERAENAQIPKMIRSATPNDIYVGAVIWYQREEAIDNSWHVVEEVLNPKCDFKAYVALCGARYGLEDAFVELS
jgi:hypothetical protein